jgi:hypothetical protein
MFWRATACKVLASGGRQVVVDVVEQRRPKFW